MDDTPRPRVDWRRLLLEAAAVVLSILAAFAVDAWWDGRQLRLQERELLSGLLADFESSRPDLVSRLTLSHRMAAGTGALLDFADGQRLPARVVVPDSLVLAVLGGPTYDPATNTLDAALASGEIEIIRSDALKRELAHWRQLLSDTGEDEREVRRVTNEQVIPLLSRTLDLRPHFAGVLAWSGGDPYGAGRRIAAGGPEDPDGHATLEMTSELAGALSIRRFYADFSAADLQDLLEALDRAVEILRRELDSAPTRGRP